MKIQLLQGDITVVETEVIVNAANASLLGGGGVDGAIHRKGGPQILEDCRAIRAKQGKCATGEAVITRAGNLPAERVIHTVGPVWQDGEQGEPELLAQCYRNSILLALAAGYTRIAFPNISTGVYRFPKALAAPIAIATVQAFAQDERLAEVLFVCFDEENFQLYEEILGSQ